MHSQPLMNNHFHFPIVVELVTSHMSEQKPKQEDGWSKSTHNKQMQLLVSGTCCVCVCVVGGCIVMLKVYTFLTDHLFGQLKKHLQGCWFHSNEEKEIIVYEWLWMQAFLKSKWDKCIMW